MDDLIGRHEVLKLLDAVPSEEFATKAMLIGGVKALPSAQPELSPCDVCRYYPPSSMDGKPCTICPAERKI